MPERFESHVYKPETTKLMKDAFDEARPKIKIVENNRELTRGLLASAILDQVSAGLMTARRSSLAPLRL
jgi:hypothetical protein